MLLIGLDVSTSCTGYTVFRRFTEGDELVGMGFIKLGKHKTLFGKISAITEKIDDLIRDARDGDTEPVKFYTAVPLKRTGFGSINTITLLWMFHGMLSQALWESYGIELLTIKENEARRQFGIVKDKKAGIHIKEAGRLFTMKDIEMYNYPMEWEYTRSGNVKGGTYDMTDAYVIAKFALALC